MGNPTAMHDWSFDKGTPLSPLLQRILALQTKEQHFRSRSNNTCPSDAEGQVSLVLEKGNAIVFYKELLTLFSIRLQQDVYSLSSQSDLAKAERIYGSALQSLTRQINGLIRKTPDRLLAMSPGTGWAQYIADKSAAKNVVGEKLASWRRREKEYQKKYFKLIAPINSDHKTLSLEIYPITPRETRREKWLDENRTWEAVSSELDSIFDGLIRSRQGIASSLGFENYGQYLEKKKQDEDLSCPFADKISASSRTLLSKMHRRRKRHLGLARLRPFDMNTRNIKGFADAEDWIAKTGALLQGLHSSLYDMFRTIIDEKLYDLQPRRGKAPASFCIQLPYSKKPYIFMNLRGERKDVMTGIHETGHALHICASFKKFNNFFNYKVNPATSEFFALTLELLSFQHLESYYGNTLDVSWAQRKFIESLLNAFLTFDTIHTFEKSIYRDQTSASQRKKLFTEAISGNLGLLDYSGHEKALELWAYRIPLLVSSPGYFSNYTHTQLGALFFFDGVRKGKFSIGDYIALMNEKGNAGIGEIYEKIGFKLCPESIDSIFGTLTEMLPLA